MSGPERLPRHVEIHRALDDDRLVVGDLDDGRDVGRGQRLAQTRELLDVDPDVGAGGRQQRVHLLERRTRRPQVPHAHLRRARVRVLEQVEEIEPADGGPFCEVPRQRRRRHRRLRVRAVAALHVPRHGAIDDQQSIGLDPTGHQFRVLAQEEILQPLDLKSTYFNPERALQTGIAACETGNVYERNTCKDSGMEDYAGWRQGLIWGEVHDGNAYFLGGSAGHAGLFSSARETTTIASQFLAGHSKLLKAKACELFRTNLTEGLNEARSIGWQLAATSLSTAGGSLPPDSFGHTGFTGTSCWIDPDNERIFVLLTNRTHRALPFENINAVRREFHSLAVKALNQQQL